MMVMQVKEHQQRRRKHTIVRCALLSVAALTTKDSQPWMVAAFQPSQSLQTSTLRIRHQHDFLHASNHRKRSFLQYSKHSSSNSNSYDRNNNNNSNHSDYQKKQQHRNRYRGDEHSKWLLATTESMLNSTATYSHNGKYHQLLSMFSAWEKKKRYDSNAPHQMELILKRLLQEQAHLQVPIVTIELYNQLLDTWACAAHFGTAAVPQLAAQRAREILVLLQETYEAQQKQQSGDINLGLQLQPNSKSFDCVFHVVCKMDGPRMGRRVLHWMEYLDRVGRNPYSKPQYKHYVLALGYIANDGINAGKAAEGFLRHMEKIGIVPDTVCYNMAIKAWYTSSKRGGSGRQAAEQADWILEEMKAPKDIVTYSTVISAWATSGMQSHAVARVEELLRQIDQDPNVEPNTIVLNSVMSAWVKSKNPAAINRTEELLLHMHSNKSADLISYNTHIHALSMHASNRPGSAERAHRILMSLEERYNSASAGHIQFRPNRFTYNMVIDAYAKCPLPNSPWRSVEVLRRLIGHDALQPDTSSFNQALAALSRCIKPGSERLAEELLEYMEQAYKLNVHPKAKPDAWSYTSAIIAWGRSNEPDAPERAEVLLSTMKAQYQAGDRNILNRNAFNAVIDCWAKSNRGTYGARKAEAILKEMEDFAVKTEDRSFAPNSMTYNAVLNSWARSGTLCCGHKAETYLQLMWELHHAGHSQVRPNAMSFNTVINAISKSKNEARAQKALRLLRRMDKLYQGGYKEARPDAVTYTSVLNSCAFPAHEDKKIRRKALDTAMFTLDELRSSRYGAPNQITYGTFIKACATLLEDDDEFRRILIAKTFQQACADGQVGEMVLSNLREASPGNLYHELLEGAIAQKSGSDVKVEDLPLAWRKNLQKTDRPKARWKRNRIRLRP